MKNIENKKTWELIISVIDRVISRTIETKGDGNAIKEKCSELASYSFKADIETAKITEQDLFIMEYDGKVFGSNIFVRLKRYYYILSNMQNLDYSKRINTFYIRCT